MKVLYIALFGGCGCVTRYLVSGWTYTLLGRAMPWGTLAVNVLGSLLLGFLLDINLRSAFFNPDVRVGLAVGFMGGFTTFSTFSYETVRLLEEGSWWQAGGNVLLNVCVCVVFSAMGILLARQL